MNEYIVVDIGGHIHRVSAFNAGDAGNAADLEGYDVVAVIRTDHLDKIVGSDGLAELAAQ